MIDLYKNLPPAQDTPELKQQRERAAALARATRSRPALDFSRPGKCVARSIGELYALQPREEVKRSERDRRFDALPVVLQRAAQKQDITDIDMLECTAQVYKRMIGGETSVHSSDLAKKLNLSSSAQADDLLTKAVQAGLLRERLCFGLDRKFGLPRS